MKTLAILSIALSAVLVAGCTSPAPVQNDGTGDPGSPPATPPGGGRTVFQQAGSSTVLPIAQAWAEEYRLRDPSTELVVAGGGTGAGFKQFCRGEVHIADASRPIKDSEKADCAANGVDPFELTVAIDGLAVVLSKANTFVDHLTVAELNKIWTANTSKQANYWDEVRPGAGWPHERILLYGPGTDSGTFDYFVEVIIHPFDGTATKGRSDFTKSEDDNVLVQGVATGAKAAYSLAYFGLYYAEQNADKIRTVPIDDEKAGNGDGPFAPTAATVEGGQYQPLARPIFMYTDGAPTGKLKGYFQYGLSDEGQAVVQEEGYIKLPAAKLAEMRAKVGS